MAAVNPRPPSLRSGVYDDEPAQFGDVAAVFKYMIENHIRYSLSSPPLLKDVKEGSFVWDKTANRLYTNSGNALKYVAFS